MSNITIPKVIKEYLIELSNRYSNRLNEEIDFNVNLDGAHIDDFISMGMNPLHIITSLVPPDFISEEEDKDFFGWSNLETAKAIQMIEILLENGAKIDIISEDGDTVVDYAILTGNSQFINYILSKEVSVFVNRSVLEFAHNLMDNDRLTKLIYLRLAEMFRENNLKEEVQNHKFD